MSTPATGTDHAPEVDHAANIAASDEFARLLSAAIAEGHERAPVVSEDFTTERPAPISATIATEAPHPPQKAIGWAGRAARSARRDFAEHLRLMRAGPTDRPKPKRNRFTVLDLADGYCRFPVTDDAPHFFCGSPSGERSYCKHHRSICWSPR